MTTSSTPVDATPTHCRFCATAPSTRSPSATAPASNARFRRKTSTCSRCNQAMWTREPAASSSARDTTEAICANVLISAVLGTRLPGPGTQYVSQSLCFLGAVRPGDRLTVQMQVTSKDTATHHVTLACTCTNQTGVVVFQGQVEVVAPTERMERARTALPEYTRCAGPHRPAAPAGACRALATDSVTVAHPCDAPSLSAALEARQWRG